MVKADMVSGRIRDWRCAPEGDFGHAIIEAKDGIEVLASLLKYRPYVNFKVTLALTVDQVIETVGRMWRKSSPFFRLSSIQFYAERLSIIDVLAAAILFGLSASFFGRYHRYTHGNNQKDS